MTPPLKHADGLKRCPWPKDDPLYVAYHDDEWGVPEFDDRALFEKLILDGFQAGLSWITILRKRDNFRNAFDDFAPEKIARYTPKKVERLMQDAGIVRNRMKIEGTVLSARAWLDIMEKGPGFSQLLWDFCDGKPKVNNFRSIKQVPAETAVSRAISKDLAGRGFKFCRPDHRLRLHAGGRHGQRPSRHLPPPRGLQEAGEVKTLAPSQRRARSAGRADRAPGSACCRDAGSTCSIPRRSTSRWRTSRTGWHGSRAGTARPWARTSSRWRSIACWSRPSRASSSRLDRAGRLAVLLHDAPEYVIGDMISPFKAVIGDNYKAVEARLLAAIHIRFGLPAAPSAELLALIKAADQRAAYLEATQLAGFTAGGSGAILRQAAGALRRDAARLPDAVARRNRRSALSRTLCTTVSRLTLSRHHSAAHI